MMVLEKGGMFLISEVPLYLHVAASGFRGSLKRIQLTFIWTTANWPRGTTSRGGFRREIGPPRDGHARLGTDGPALGRMGPPRDGQTSPTKKRFFSWTEFLPSLSAVQFECSHALSLQGYLAHKKTHPPRTLP